MAWRLLKKGPEMPIDETAAAAAAAGSAVAIHAPAYDGVCAPS